MKKTVANAGAPDSAFEFVLMDENGVVLQTLPLNGTGSAAFDSIVYDADDVGVYTYKVSEVNRGEAGWIYDDTVYTVTVTVSRNGEVLEKDIVITNDAGKVCSSVEFVNDYRSGEKTPLEDLGDGGIPLTGLGDDEIPLTTIPATGDMFTVWAMLSVVSAAGLAGVTFMGRKKREEI